MLHCVLTEDQKPYVPQSCCVRDRFYRYVNREVCQKWRFGPPGSPDDGAINRAVYYEVWSYLRTVTYSRTSFIQTSWETCFWSR